MQIVGNGGKIAKLGLVLSLGISVSGCSLINPHIGWERFTIGEKRLEENRPAEMKDAPTIRESIQYAQRAQDDLRQKIGDQSTFRNGIAIAEILLAGGLGTAALLGASEDVLISGAIAGVTGLGLAAWFDSTPRQRTYLLGIKALICAVDATTPLQSFRGSDNKLIALNAALQNTEASMGLVQRDAAFLKSLAPASPLVAFAATEAARAQGVVNAGKLAHESGTKLRHKVLNAGTNLETVVDQIGAHVIGEVIQTESQLSELRGLLQDLVFQAPGFIRVPDAGAFPQVKSVNDERFDSSGQAAPKADASDIANAEMSLRATLGQLSAAIAQASAGARAVESDVQAVDAAKSVDKLKSCGVEVGSALETLSIDRAGTMEFAEGVAGRQGFTVTGGNGKYSGVFLGGPQGLSHEQNVPFGKLFDIVATDKTVAGEYRFVISDITGSEVIVPVRVVKPDGPKVEDQDNAGPVADEAVKALQRELKALEFLAVGSPVDGKREPGKNTEQAMAALLKTTGYTGKAVKDITTAAFRVYISVLNTKLDLQAAANSKGIRNAAIQLMLKKKGHYAGEATGVIANTAADPTIVAIKAYDGSAAVPAADDAALETALNAVRDKLRGDGGVIDGEDKL